MKNTGCLIFSFSMLCLMTVPRNANGQSENTATGITEPILDVTLSSPVAGIVGARFFKEGEFVRGGQTVVELDRKLEELETARRKAIAERSKADFEATSVLFKNTKGISGEELEKKQLEYKVANAEYEIAAEQLRKRQIVSPLSGSIAELFREVGEACQANERLVRIVDTRRCYFVCNVEGKAGPGLRIGQAATVEVEAGASTAVFQAIISFVSPVVDPASGLLKVKAIFENPDERIRPGLAGTMRLARQVNGN